MISTHRLILLFIGINLIIGIASAIYENPAIYNDNFLSVEQGLYEDFGADFVTEDSLNGIQSENTLQETSVGNSLSWGKILFDVFVQGINPFSFMPGDFDTMAEQIAAQLLILFRALMSILIVIEAIMFFKNKKSS
jgi:hypothetical protein